MKNPDAGLLARALAEMPDAVVVFPPSAATRAARLQRLRPKLTRLSDEQLGAIERVIDQLIETEAPAGDPEAAS